MAVSHIFITLLLFLLFISDSQACKCFPPTIQRSYYPPTTVSFVKARVLSVRMTKKAEPSVLILLKVLFDYKGCLKKGEKISVFTFLSSASCGVTLKERKKYVLPIREAGIRTIISCDFIKLVRKLSEEEKKFLEERQIICDDVRSCASGQRPAGCKRLGCESLTPPCKRAKSCEDNFCLGCGTIDWFDRDGFLTCE